MYVQEVESPVIVMESQVDEKNKEKDTEIKEPEKKTKPGKGKYNKPKGSVPRADNGDYLPDPTAVGPHTLLGTTKGRKGTYVQGSSFDAKGKFRGRTDCTDHGRPKEHTNPHFHPASSPNSVDDAQPISQGVPEWLMM